jgi:hypothetical protein
VSTVCFLVILVSSIFLRKRKYELFHIMHVAFSVLVLVTLYRRRPYIRIKTSIFVIICSLLFGINKHFSIGRYAHFRLFRKTTATLHPLPNGGTRIALNRSIHNSRAGLQARLWIPKIRKFQTHAMTTTATSPVTFVISAQTGIHRRTPQAGYCGAMRGPQLRLTDHMERCRCLTSTMLRF